MKKVLFIVMLLTAWVGAQAQFQVGGTLGVDVTNVGSDGEGSVTQTTLAITPEVGYRFNKTWTVGAQVGFGVVSLEGESLTKFAIMPYVRATFASVKMVDFFGEAAIGYGHQSVEGYGVSGTILALRPGMAINFSPKFAVIARTNLLQYEYWDGDHGTEFSINKGFDLGVQFTF